MKKLLFLLVLLPISYFAQAGIVVGNGLSHQHTMKPGEQTNGQILIRNTGNTLEEVNIYRRDYLFNDQGQSFFPEEGSLDRSNAGWVNFNTTYLQLQPGEEKSITYQIQVPADTSLKGTYWSVVMIEGVGSPAPDNSQKGLQVSTKVRYAIQLIAHIGNTGSRQLQFNDYQIKKTEKGNVLEITMENSGERLLQPSLKIEAYNEEGDVAGQYTTRKRKLYPSTSLRFAVALSDLPAGRYQALILADCADEGVYGANADFKISTNIE